MTPLLLRSQGLALLAREERSQLVGARFNIPAAPVGQDRPGLPKNDEDPVHDSWEGPETGGPFR